jgi:cytochrome c553
MPKPASQASLIVFLLIGALARAAEPAKVETPEQKATSEQEVFFEQRVRPLLMAKCLECHGEKKQEGGLRLDSRPAILRGNESGPAVVAGKPEESRLLEVIGYDDAIKMPPKQKLAEAEIATLTAWVKIGAPWPGSENPPAPALGQSATPEGIVKARATHWAFQPVRRAPPPDVKDTAWGTTPIDRFILAKLEENGLSPSPQADRRTLLRRVSFDLIGLPPTAEEAAAFEGDHSADAWATVVDRLLRSPHYGERWGRHWLDVARYADTKGYVFTEERKYPFSYTYRDYVIGAFNRDLPFDRFIIEQIAADQLPLAEDKAALAAMGFLTLGRRFGNNVNDIIDDRIDVVTRGLMGLTTTCARCHDHKYDPIPSDDYYSLYGVFASSVEPADLPLMGPPVINEAYQAYETELAKREAVLEAFVAEKLGTLIDELRSRTTDYLVAVVRKDGQELPQGIGISLGPGDVRREVVTRWRNYLQETAKEPHPVFGPWHALAALPADGFGDAAAKITAGLNDAPDAQPRTNSLVKQALAAAAPQSMFDVATIYGKLLVETNTRWVALTRGQPAEAAGASAPSIPPTALPEAPAEELRQVLYAEKSPTAVARDETRRLFDRATKNKMAELKRAVDSFKANSPAAPPRAMVLNDAPQPTQPHVLIRGNAGRPGKEVARRFLQVLSSPDAPAFQKGSGRLELAELIASPNNPLTVRVIVNRVWMHHFGKGLVTTPSDFGARGAAPSHPELLDYLASTFIEEGWSLKELHRRILLSNVYRQASDDRPEAIKVDPENRLIWKMNRQRLEFEPMRDALLAVAGRLDGMIGGRPVDLFASPFTTRRGVYAFIDRQDLPGTLRVFDFASPDVSTPMRPQTVVPQQALFGMNSPFVVEQAKALASRPEVASAASSESKVQALYRLIYARGADVDEVSAGIRFLDAPAEPESAAAAWQYGFGEYDKAMREVRGFTALKHFQEGRWQNGPQLPDPVIGWVNLTAEGGHPGGDLKHVAIRRWTAQVAGFISMTGTLTHPAADGDGVRGRVVSSRNGELGAWTIHHGKVETRLDRVEVQAGETLDFVVDCLTNEGNDEFTWPPVVTLTTTAGGKTSDQQFSAAADFRSSAPGSKGLMPLEQYAQALLLANEFVFVD